MFDINALDINGNPIKDIYIYVEKIDSCSFCHKKVTPYMWEITYVTYQ